MQSHLYELQNPSNCTSARKLLCTSNNGNPCGFACFTHHLLHCFMVAFWTRRTLVLDTKGVGVCYDIVYCQGSIQGVRELPSQKIPTVVQIAMQKVLLECQINPEWSKMTCDTTLYNLKTQIFPGGTNPKIPCPHSRNCKTSVSSECQYI